MFGMHNQPLVQGVGINCERIFKIKAVSSHKPDADPVLVAQGFIPFKKGQAFYVLSHYPQLDAYFVSNQYAVPFGRNALCGLVPTPLFNVVDLYSADSTKIPAPTPSLPSPPHSPSSTFTLPNPGLHGVDFSIVSVGVSLKDGGGDPLVFSINATLTLKDGRVGTASVERQFSDFDRFHTLLLTQANPEKVRFISSLPVQTGVGADMQHALNVYVNSVFVQGFGDVLCKSLLNDVDGTGASFTIAKSSAVQNQIVPPNVTAPQQPSRPHHAAPPQPNRPSNVAVLNRPHLIENRSSLASNSSNSYEKHSSLLAAAAENRSSLAFSEANRQSLLSEQNRASIQSLSNPPNDFRSSVTSESFLEHRSSLMSKHGSVLSRNSNRFSISSRRGSAMVGISTVDLDPALAKDNGGDAAADTVPRAPVTQFAAGGPVRTSLAIEEIGEETIPEVIVEVEEVDEEEKKKRNRNFVVNGLPADFEGLSMQYQSPGASLAKPNGGSSRRGSEAVHFPARTSSKQQLVEANPQLLAHEATAINAFFHDEDGGLNSHAGEARNLDKPAMVTRASHSSLRESGSVIGRSSSLGWRRDG
ncbi:hypothetical protein HDU82_003189 [Entophlyctis luteolus]|nr:hypothetical protein HDU82_003189 [Entophlyctis luteolus]